MSYRHVPLMPGEIYHVFNRSVGREKILQSYSDYQRFMDTILFYQYSELEMRFSHYYNLSLKKRQEIIKNLEHKGDKLVHVYAFCLMPTHFHFLLEELQPKGIVTFISNIENSYAKYFNLKFERHGSLFQNRFKAVIITSNEQLLEVCKYIHLNPIEAGLVFDPQDLSRYPWSSWRIYCQDEYDNFVQKNLIMNFFKNVKDLQEFTLGSSESYTS